MTKDELIPISMDRRSKVQHGHAVSRICGDDVGFVVWNESRNVWRLKWYGHGCSLTCGFAQHLCNQLDLSDVTTMHPRALAMVPTDVPSGRKSCIQVVLDALLQAVSDNANS